MPLQKPHLQLQPRANPPSTKRQQARERRRTLHTISELSVTKAATPEFNSFIAAIQRQPRNQTSDPKTRAGDEETVQKRSLPQNLSSRQDIQGRSAVATSSAHATANHQSRFEQGVHSRDIKSDREGWNAKRAQARSQRERAATQGYHRQSLQQLTQDGSFPTVPRKAVHSASRSSLRSYSSHPHLLVNSYSLNGFSSSSSSTGILDRRTSIGTIGSQPNAWTHKRDTAGEYTDGESLQATLNSALQKPQSGSPSDTPPMAAALRPLPVALPSMKQRYYPMPPEHHGNSEQSTPKVSVRPGSTTRTTSLPTIRINHVALSQQSRRHSLSRSSQKHHQDDVHRARLESLAALTGTQPASHDQRRTSPSNLAPPHQIRISSQEKHRASLHRHAQSSMYLRPPPQYNPQRTLTRSRETTVGPSQSSVALVQRVVPKRENLSQWKAEREEAKLGFSDTRRADIKERVRRANELELEKEEELIQTGERERCAAAKKKRGCLCSVLRFFKVKV